MNLTGLGDLTISGTSYFTSDSRLKTNVVALENSTLDKIMNLRPSRYTKTASAYDKNGNIIFNTEGENSIQDFGFIAQDVYKIFPELVSKPTNESKELWAVDYARLSVMLTKAMQEQNVLILNQQKEIEELKALMQTVLKKK